MSPRQLQFFPSNLLWKWSLPASLPKGLSYDSFSQVNPHLSGCHHGQEHSREGFSFFFFSIPVNQSYLPQTPPPPPNKTPPPTVSLATRGLPFRARPGFFADDID